MRRFLALLRQRQKNKKTACAVLPSDLQQHHHRVPPPPTDQRDHQRTSLLGRDLLSQSAVCGEELWRLKFVEITTIPFLPKKNGQIVVGQSGAPLHDERQLPSSTALTASPSLEACQAAAGPSQPKLPIPIPPTCRRWGRCVDDEVGRCGLNNPLTPYHFCDN